MGVRREEGADVVEDDEAHGVFADGALGGGVSAVGSLGMKVVCIHGLGVR